MSKVKALTMQEAFDKSAWHLISKMKRCTNAQGRCLYRNASYTNSCAIGVLLPDSMYDPRMDSDREEEGWGSIGSILINFPAIKNRFKNLDGIYIDFLASLQSIHDTSHPDNWFDELKELAEDYSLKFNFEMK